MANLQDFLDAERYRFNQWFNQHRKPEQIENENDIDDAWEIWKAAVSERNPEPVGYVGFSSDGQINKFRQSSFFCGRPVYMTPFDAEQKNGEKQ